MDRSLRMLLGLLLAVVLLAACGQAAGTGSTGGSATQAPQATAAAEQPTAMVEQPTAMAEQPTARAAQPTAMAEQPTAMAEQPTAMAEQPTAMAEHPTSGATGTSGDLLDTVKKRGKLIISTDANYKPQSFKNPDGTFEGFDVDVGREIAKRLGVEAEFLDINFDIITAGNWNGRWDLNAGSMTITADRQKVLYFSTPYYYTPASFVVHKDSKATSIDDLKGKNVGVGAATTYQDYLQGKLSLTNEQVLRPPPDGAQAKIYDTDQAALTDLALGDGVRVDAVLTALPTAQDAIKSGQPLKILGDPVYYEDLGIAIDKQSPQDSKSLADAVSKIIDDMHADGTLTNLSNKYYGVDLTTKK